MINYLAPSPLPLPDNKQIEFRWLFRSSLQSQKRQNRKCVTTCVPVDASLAPLMPLSHLCGSIRSSLRFYDGGEPKKTSNIPRRPRRNHIDHNQNVNLPRDLPQDNRCLPPTKIFVELTESWIKRYKCERGFRRLRKGCDPTSREIFNEIVTN